MRVLKCSPVSLRLSLSRRDSCVAIPPGLSPSPPCRAAALSWVYLLGLQDGDQEQPTGLWKSWTVLLRSSLQNNQCLDMLSLNPASSVLNWFSHDLLCTRDKYMPIFHLFKNFLPWSSHNKPIIQAHWLNFPLLLNTRGNKNKTFSLNTKVQENKLV